MWFFISLLGYLFLAIVFVLDKLILTKSIDKPVVYTFYSTIFMFGALLTWPFGVELLISVDWIWATVSGLAFGFALWTMFIAVKKEEASRINPFIGSIITIATFGLASIFLGESLNAWQIIGILLLFFATLLLSFFGEQHGKRGLSVGFLWGILSGILFAVSHTTAKYIYEIYPFLTGFIWTRATVGLVGLVCLFFPAVWDTFKRKESKSLKHCKKKGFAKKHAVGIVVTNKVLGVLAVVLIQYAIAIGSVTIVNALVGVQYAIMLLMIYLLTIYTPKIFKEHFSKGELKVEIIAIALIIVGSAMVVF